VIDHRKDHIRRFSDLARSRQHCLDLDRTHMGTVAADIVQLLLVKP
jgi:hypothetical protein